MYLPTLLEKGNIWVSGRGNVNGIIGWFPPGTSAKAKHRSHTLARLYWAGGRKSIQRINKYEAQLATSQPEKECYYLFTIGATSQKQGMGKMMLDVLLQQADAEEMPIYLQNTNKKMSGFFEKNGFRVYDEAVLHRSAPPISLMWREPQPIAVSSMPAL
eukprot:Selendium_serpulae@DN5439_c0_g1_i9.p1